MRAKTCIALTILALFAAAVVFSGIERGIEIWRRRERVLEQEIVRRPQPVRLAVEEEEEETVSSASSDETRPSAINWDVPFTSQAPFANWDEVHKEACEEASILMVLRYFSGDPFESEEEADAALDEVLAANEAMGFAVDTTADQVRMLLLSLDPSLSASLIRNPSVDTLKAVLGDGALVIVPASGTALGNPYFRVPGPRYHMLVLRGFTDDGYVITNDPGTKRGEEFVYRWDVLMDAMHDWNGGAVESGEKVVVVVRSS